MIFRADRDHPDTMPSGLEPEEQVSPMPFVMAIAVALAAFAAIAFILVVAFG